MADPSRSLTSSPTPIRETQPQLSIPTTTSKGTFRGRALLDTPPPNAEPTELQRSQRLRVPTARKQAQLESQQKRQKPRTVDKTQLPSQAHPPDSIPQASRHRKTCALVIHSPEQTDGEETGHGARETHNKRPPKYSSQPRSSARNTQLAGDSESQYTYETQTVANSQLAQELGQLLNRDFTGESTQVLYETAKAIANDNSIPMGIKGRYSQIVSSPPTQVNIGGGYIHDRLRDIVATSHTEFTRKRPAPNRLLGTSKYARISSLENNTPNLDTSRPHPMRPPPLQLSYQDPCAGRRGLDLCSSPAPQPCLWKPTASRQTAGAQHVQQVDSDSDIAESEQPALEAPQEENTPEEEDHSAEIVATVSGEPVPVPGKSGIGKYPEVRRVVTAAIVDMLVIACVRGVYQRTETYRRWAIHAYRRQWKRFMKDKPYKCPPEYLLRVMRARFSWLRTTVKARVGESVQQSYGFHNPPESAEQMQENRELSARLGPNTFHCRDLIPDTNQYMNTAIRRAIGAGFFKGRDSIGAEYWESFKPMPLEAVAFILTMMQTTIEEFRTGVYDPRDLRSSRQEPVFDAHLFGLHEYAKVASTRLRRFQEEWYQYGIKCAGVSIPEDNGRDFCQPVTQAHQVRPDTPEIDKNGRYTAKAKAKGRESASDESEGELDELGGSDQEIEDDPEAGADA